MQNSAECTWYENVCKISKVKCFVRYLGKISIFYWRINNNNKHSVKFQYKQKYNRRWTLVNCFFARICAIYLNERNVEFSLRLKNMACTWFFLQTHFPFPWICTSLTHKFSSPRKNLVSWHSQCQFDVPARQIFYFFESFFPKIRICVNNPQCNRNRFWFKIIVS